MTDEQAEILGWFCHMLQAASGDGGKKRAAGLKPGWKVDPSHEGAIFSHLTKWKRGERVDADSGAHPLVHAAWRCLAVAWQETYGNAADAIEAEANHELHKKVRRVWDEAWFSPEHDGVAKELDRVGWRGNKPSPYDLGAKGGRVTD